MWRKTTKRAVSSVQLLFYEMGLMTKERKSSISLILTLLFIIPLGVTLWLQGSLKQRLDAHAIPPEQIFGSPLPESLEVVLSQKTNDGLYARTILRPLNARLDVMVVPSENYRGGSDLLDILKRSKAFKEQTPIAPSIVSLFLAEINPIRSKLIKTIEVLIGGLPVTVSQVESKDKEMFFLGIWSKNGKQTGLVILDPDRRLTEENLTAALRGLPPPAEQ